MEAREPRSEWQASKYSNEIIKKTVGEIRTFLDELANGTSNYRSLHNLTEQVEHQYHGRFLIELIQNAHDALFEEDVDGDHGRLEIIITMDEKPFGALYVANDGHPFSDSNFQSLSKFGQSDKDPEKHIGNKGIGFRSVLEITKAPEIYSREKHGSENFDGYCFRFDPDITTKFEESILELLLGNDRPKSHLDSTIPLIEWGEKRLHDFRSRCVSSDQRWLFRELNYLSPYLLPTPVMSFLELPLLQDLEKKGFSTVIRLPFWCENATEQAISEVERLDENTVLFLNRVKSLWLDSSRIQRLIERKIIRFLNDPLSGKEIHISYATNTDTGPIRPKCYWQWERQIGGIENPSEAKTIREAVSNLPGKWPELRKATVSFAVKIDERPESGKINIFLPTALPSGCTAHFNGPFYGDISRTDIDFGKPFNHLLLETIAKMSIETVLRSLAGKGVEESWAIIDILAPFPKIGDSGRKWWSLIEKAAACNELNIEDAFLAFTDDGWNCFLEATLLPDLRGAKVINEAQLRMAATFPVFHSNLSSREDQILELFAALRVSALPSNEDVANTLENLAEKLYVAGDEADWNGFWHDVSILLPHDGNALLEKKVLLGTDNELHASGAGCAVFFRPRTGGTDDEVLTEGAIEDIPRNLRSLIAFLHESIQVHTPRPEGGIRKTPIHTYLDSASLVQAFGVEHILRGVLIPATPQLPVPLRSEYEGLCADIISWGMRLVNSLIAKDRGEKTLKYMSSLPVPCQGGWFPLGEAYFGPGWSGTVGNELQTYLKGANTQECNKVMDRMMLPPQHELWGDAGRIDQELFTKTGAFDGLQPVKITPTDWHAQFNIAGWRAVQLPEKAPPCFDEDFWKMYVEHIKNALTPYYKGEFPYEIQELYILPGMDRIAKLDKPTRFAFMKIMLRSLPALQDAWQTVKISKINPATHSFPPCESPLHFWLRHMRWMIALTEGGFEEFCPKEKWYIPSLALAGRSHQFTHLNPLSGELAAKLDSIPALISILEQLGMPRFDPEGSSDNVRLLTDLVNALLNPEVEIVNRDVFLGQVRLAWNLFEPSENSRFPPSILVHTNTAGLQAVTPTEEEPVYLPDATSSFLDGLELHSKPIIAIEPKDAKRLADGFKRTYGKGVRLASELRMQPVVNGEAWKRETAQLLSASELKWIIPVVLSVFAHSGNQARGTQTKTFAKAVESLREARICQADNLDACLWQGQELLVTTPVPALWLQRTRTLLALKEVHETPSQLSEGLGAIVDRSDLDIPLKLVLSKLDGHNEYSRDTITDALKQLKISESHLAEVEQIWLGDLSWTIRLLKPMLLLFNNEESKLSSLTEVNSRESLRRCLEALKLGTLLPDQVLAIVRKCENFQHLGKELYKTFGSEFQLERWNQVLGLLGEALVINEDAAEQFRNHLDSARLPLRSIMRRILRDHPGTFLFSDLADTLENLPCPEEYSHLYWTVEFGVVMETVKPLYIQWKASPQEIQAIEQAKSEEDLIQNLDVLKLEPTVDPIQIYARNRDHCRKLLQKIQEAGILWCLKSGVDAEYWEKDTNDLLLQFDEHLKKEGFLDLWNDSECFSVLKLLPASATQQPFWEKLVAASDLNTLLGSLGISSKELQSAKERLEDHKEKERERKRLVMVCGKDFDSSEENLCELWDHLTETIDENDLPEISLNKIADLKEVISRMGTAGHRSAGKRLLKPKGRISKAKENLIGLIGEIHAYRVLLKMYGPTVVNADCWKSENSLRKFPNRVVDDSFGCDFVINYKGKAYHIEVKATEGEDEYFELGVTIIRHAVEVANKKNTKFLILHIIKALSTEPGFLFLPNPYDRQHQRSYHIENAGLKIRYRRAS